MATAAKGTNWFAVWVSAGVVGVIALVVVLVLVLNNMASAPAARPDSAGINQSTGAIQIGSGENEVDVYSDFYCPHCQEFEAAYGEEIRTLLEDGEITLNVHPVALSRLNAASGTDFSKRASNALYCVAEAEPDAAYPFFVDLFAEYPTGAGLTDEQLASIASDAGAGDVSSCLADRTWDDLVAEQTTSIPPNPTTGDAGTPTVVVNGEWITLTGDPKADLSGNF